MAKKQFTLGKKENTKKPVKQSLNLLLKENTPFNIDELNLDVNQQVIQTLIENFGPKWKYRTQKKALEVTGVKLSYTQLKELEKGKTWLQKNFFVLLLLLAQEQNRNVTLTFTTEKEIILK